MPNTEERSLAIVLRTRPHGESDKIVTFLSRDWGKLTGIAKGAKRSRRRFVNVLEPFTHIQLRFRPSRVDGPNDLAFILGCELVRSFRRPSVDLECFALASYVVEVADLMVVGREVGYEMYDLVLQHLTILEEQDTVSPLFPSLFALQLLQHVGYAPDLTTCQQCGKLLTGATAAVSFSPQLNGLVCANCRGHTGVMLYLCAETLQVLQHSQSKIVRMPHNISVRANREMQALATRLLIQHLPRPLKSLVFLEQAGRQLNDFASQHEGDRIVEKPVQN